MSYKTYRMWQGIIGLIMGAIVGISVAMDIWVVPVIAIFAGIAAGLILRRTVKEVVADERTYTVAGHASRLTLQIVAIGMAMMGMVLEVLDRGKNGILSQSAVTLLFATCALLVVNALVYTYYNRKLGGKE